MGRMIVVVGPLCPNRIQIMSIDQDTWICIQRCRPTPHITTAIAIPHVDGVYIRYIHESDHRTPWFICYQLSRIDIYLHIYIVSERERERDPTHQHVENTPAARCTIRSGTLVTAGDAAGEGSSLGCHCGRVSLATTTTTPLPLPSCSIRTLVAWWCHESYYY